MDVGKATTLLRAIAAVDESSSLAEVKAAVRDRGRLVAMLDSEGVRLTRLLAALTGCPEKAFGDAARSSQREGRRMRQRGDTAEEVPAFGEALANGDVSGEHVDLMGSALRGAEGDKRKKLAEKADELVEVAKTATLDEFARRLRDEMRRLDDDDGRKKHERQKSGSRLWHKSDPITGMGKIWMEIDPLSYAKFVARNEALRGGAVRRAGAGGMSVRSDPEAGVPSGDGVHRGPERRGADDGPARGDRRARRQPRSTSAVRRRLTGACRSSFLGRCSRICCPRPW